MQEEAASPQVEEAIQRALANESETELRITSTDYHPLPLTVTDALRIIECLRENPRFRTLCTSRDMDGAALNVFRCDLPLCTSVSTVILANTQLGNEKLQRLLPAFRNTSVTSLRLTCHAIQGQRGGEVIRDLLVGNNTLLELYLSGISFSEVAIALWRVLAENNNNTLLVLNLIYSVIGREASIALGRVLADNNNNNRLQTLYLSRCRINNAVLACLLLSMGDMRNNFLTHLDLGDNNIEGAEGGRQVGLLLQCFRQLKILTLNYNNLGPLGVRALAPGLATSSHLEWLDLVRCGLGNDCMANLIPDGQVNRTLTRLNLVGNHYIYGLVGGENVIALVSRCTNLDRIDLNDNTLSPDRQRRLDLLLDRKRLCTRASALAGSTFPVLFRAVEEAHRHEHGLSAIFVILQNDGEDLFCNAYDRAI